MAITTKQVHKITNSALYKLKVVSHIFSHQSHENSKTVIHLNCFLLWAHHILRSATICFLHLIHKVLELECFNLLFKVHGDELV